MANKTLDRVRVYIHELKLSAYGTAILERIEEMPSCTDLVDSHCGITTLLNRLRLLLFGSQNLHFSSSCFSRCQLHAFADLLMQRPLRTQLLSSGLFTALLQLTIGLCAGRSSDVYEG